MKMAKDPTAIGAGWTERCYRAWSRIRLLIASRFARKMREGRENALHLEEKLSLGPKKMLYLVSCREKEFLIAAGADAIVSVVEVSAVAAEGSKSMKPSLTRVQKREPRTS
ncbi:flagellar biosynthetic protein FliO [Alloacidobacterium dinghuense]|uniref:Flagellar biosynthetic protein FliO n=1 Tax=Alloacidobacterium dinghuense TaxID=2763107 RepID=A0A7G8BNN7_9BACT|nr:flagellar biosynthetic protein FliO [Alloacidobacterium dinghuense]QNI34157.1 flagellar biosynthetic protein FliO [Alloacidobacterium dinghuense]